MKHQRRLTVEGAFYSAMFQKAKNPSALYKRVIRSLDDNQTTKPRRVQSNEEVLANMRLLAKKNK